MPSTARRLARRYLPLRVRRAVHELRTSDDTPARAQAPKKQAPKSPAAAKKAGSAKPKVAPQPKAAAKPKAAPAPAKTPLVTGLEQGADLTSAVVSQIRWLLTNKEGDRAVSLAESLRRRDETRGVGDLACGLTAFLRGYPELASHHFQSVPRDIWAQHAPQEYLRSAIATQGDSALDIVRDLLANEPASMQAENWYRVLETTHGMGQADLAREVFARFEQHINDDDVQWDKSTQLHNWMQPWVAANPDSPTAPTPSTGHRTFAVMDYGHPGISRGSANIGDHVQTIASLGHLVRHQGVRFHGQEDLVDLLQELGGKVRPERQSNDVTADVEVMTVHRDASMYQDVPEDTWMLCFGWFMHALFDMGYGFPLHKNLRPIFVSFHCNKREMLTPEAVEYLKTYGPIGCRDWTTTYLLTSMGIPAFFSGCLTTTIDTVFPELTVQPPSDAPVAYADVPPGKVPSGAPVFKHSDPAVRSRSFITNVYTAYDLLENYRRNHSGMVTSRLHCYLPVRSLGMKVDFTPKNDSDIRFDGLINITDDEFLAIRDGILGKLKDVFALILGGSSEEEVYARWREITAPDVTAAQERLHELSDPPKPSIDPVAEASRIADQTVPHDAASPGSGNAVHLAIPFITSRAEAFAVLLNSIVQHTDRAVHVWALARELPDDGGQSFADRFPEITFRWVPTKGLAGDVRPLTGRPVSGEGIDKLLLAHLVPSVKRILFLPTAAVVSADIGDLYDLDLADAAIATATVASIRGGSGFGVIHGAALRLQHRTRAAAALRRTAHARHDFDFDSFDDHVLLVNLDTWRRENFATQAIGLVEAYGLNAREVLHYVAGPHRAVIPQHWAAVPTRTSAEEPGLTYWADKVKPWDKAVTAGQDAWRRSDARP